MYTVYQTTNQINGKIYIGVHKTKNPYDSYIGSGKILRQAIKVHGKSAFVKEVLFVFDNIHDAYMKEAELVNEDFIKRLDTYNVVCGGSVSADRDPNKPRKVLRGKDHPHFGKRHTDEHRRHLSEKLKGRCTRSPEIIEEFSKKMKGRVSPMKGKHLTDQDKDRKSTAALQRKKRRCEHCSKEFDPGNFLQYHGDNCKHSPFFTDDMREARSAKTSVTRTHVTKVCPYCGFQGKGGNMKRYHFDNCERLPLRDNTV